MPSQPAVSALADTLRVRPTVHLGVDVEPAWRTALVEWARSRDLVMTDRADQDATLVITTRPEPAARAPWVHSPFAGVEHLAPALPEHVLLTRTTGTMPQRIAEYVLAWVLAERWQTARYVADSASATWDPSSPPTTVRDARAVVVGTGAMGTAIAWALSTIGYGVVGLSRSARPNRAFDAVLPFADLHTGRAADATRDATARADVLVLALPHTQQTGGLITPELLRAFDGVHLLNIGRGSAIRPETLLDALGTGRVRHATLDVVEQEPLEVAAPLWRRPDITITPHISGPTLASDVVTALDAALTEIRAGVRPASAVAREHGY